MLRGQMITKDHFRFMVQQRSGRYQGNKAFDIAAMTVIAPGNALNLLIEDVNGAVLGYNIMELDKITVTAQETASALTSMGVSIVMYQDVVVTTPGAAIDVVPINRILTPNTPNYVQAESGGVYAVGGATILTEGCAAGGVPYHDDNGWVFSSDVGLNPDRNVLIEVTNNYPIPTLISVKVRVNELWIQEFDNDIFGQ